MSTKTKMKGLRLMAAGVFCLMSANIMAETSETRQLKADTVYIQRTDTVWIKEEKPTEYPLGLKKENRWNNFFLMADVGAGVFQGDHNEDAKFLDRVYWAGSVGVGKWIVPLLGVRIGMDWEKTKVNYNGWDKNGVYQADLHGAEPYYKVNGFRTMQYNTYNFHADLLVNLSSLVTRHHTRRIYDCIPYIGFGCITTWNEPKASSFCLSVGLLNSFRLCDFLDANLDIHIRRFSDKLNSFELGNKNEGNAYVGVGLTYHFTKKGF